MFVFGFAVDARGGEAATRRVRAMMAARGGEPDGVEVVSSRSAAAGLARWSVSPRDERAAPIWDAERQWLITGDVRLYNRSELLSTLRSDLRDADPSDLELARLAFARWGREVGRRLVGDFALSSGTSERGRCSRPAITWACGRFIDTRPARGSCSPAMYVRSCAYCPAPWPRLTIIRSSIGS
jgi:asparagine synthetase B (glutamine-hydrolysing)